MMGLTPLQSVAFLVHTTLLLATYARILLTLRRSRPWSKAWPMLMVFARTLRTPSQGEADELENLVQARLQVQKVHHFRTACYTCLVLISLFTAAIMARTAAGHDRLYTPTQGVLHCIIHAAFVLVAICPQRLSWKTIDIFYCCICLMGAAFVAPGVCKPMQLPQSLAIMNCGLLVLSLARRSTYVSAAMHSLFGVSAITSLLGFQPWAPAIIFFIIMQVSTLVAFTGCAHMAESSSRIHVRKALETKATKEALLAASALLRSCCDVIVELDAEGIVTSPCTALGSFLLHGTDRNLQGSRFEELLSHAEDKQRFLSRLQGLSSSNPNPGLAEAIHVRARDGNGAILCLECLCFQFRHLNDQLHYMVGLREFSDASCRRCEGRGLAPADWEGSTVPQTTCDLEAVAVLDCSSEGTPIKSVSSEFRMRIGRVPPMTHLKDILTRDAEFRSWVQKSVNTLAYGGERLPDCRVTLCMPQGRMDATCRVLHRQHGAESESAGQGELDDWEAGEEVTFDIEHVRVAFFNIMPQHRQGRCAPESWPGTRVVRMCL